MSKEHEGIIKQSSLGFQFQDSISSATTNHSNELNTSISIKNYGPLTRFQSSIQTKNVSVDNHLTSFSNVKEPATITDTEIMKKQEWDSIESCFESVGKKRKQSSQSKKAIQTETIKNGLPDILKPALNLIIVGDNPGFVSAKFQHHYSYHGNHFWPLLYESGLIPEKLTSIQDTKLLEHGIGLTCLCSRTTSSSQELTEEEIQTGVAELKLKLLKCKPKFICFNGKTIYEKISGKQVFQYFFNYAI